MDIGIVRVHLRQRIPHSLDGFYPQTHIKPHMSVVSALEFFGTQQSVSINLPCNSYRFDLAVLYFSRTSPIWASRCRPL